MVATFQVGAMGTTFSVAIEARSRQRIVLKDIQMVSTFLALALFVRKGATN